MFLAAESWKPDVCTSCVCMNSLISCFSESCPAVSCERPVLRKGQCCPYCIGETTAGPFGSAGATASASTALSRIRSCLWNLVFWLPCHTVRGVLSGGKACSRARLTRNQTPQGVLMVPRGPVLLGGVAISDFPRPHCLPPPWRSRRPFVPRGIPPCRPSTLSA